MTQHTKIKYKTHPYLLSSLIKMESDNKLSLTGIGQHNILQPLPVNLNIQTLIYEDVTFYWSTFGDLWIKLGVVNNQEFVTNKFPFKQSFLFSCDGFVIALLYSGTLKTHKVLLLGSEVQVNSILRFELFPNRDYYPIHQGEYYHNQLDCTVYQTDTGYSATLYYENIKPINSGFYITDLETGISYFSQGMILDVSFNKFIVQPWATLKDFREFQGKIKTIV